MFLKSIHLRNILSFGPDTEPLELRPLNVLIGPNGVGKSNLIDAISLLQAAPSNLTKPIQKSGGISEWLWKEPGGLHPPLARIEMLSGGLSDRQSELRHVIEFTTDGSQQFNLITEVIESMLPISEEGEWAFSYRAGRGVYGITTRGEQQTLPPEDMDAHQSILSQLKDPSRYPELTFLGKRLGEIQIHGEWVFGRKAPFRRPQSLNQTNDRLTDYAHNLGLILNRLSNMPEEKRRFLEALRKLYDGIDDFAVKVEGGSAQIYLHEGNNAIPATRLSDGTLRYLSLLVILLDSTPPPLICIEEPELGLHPDLLPTICDLMTEASERTQLIVTTHSDIIVDALSDQPESVVVCEKENGSTVMRRLDPERMKIWLEKYSLGRLWTDGELGGNRW